MWKNTRSSINSTRRQRWMWRLNDKKEDTIRSKKGELRKIYCVKCLCCVFIITTCIASRKTYTNIHKADWAGFEDYTDHKYDWVGLPTNLHHAVACFNKGRIPETRPNIPSEATALVAQRDELCTNDPANPSISTLNKNIRELVNEFKKKKWLARLENSSLSNLR